MRKTSILAKNFRKSLKKTKFRQNKASRAPVQDTLFIDHSLYNDHSVKTIISRDLVLSLSFITFSVPLLRTDTQNKQ